MTAPADHAPTLRRRLLLLLLVPVTVLLAGGVFIDYTAAIASVHGAYDQSLASAALAVAAHLDLQPDGRIGADLPPQAIAVLRTDRYDTIYYAVFDGDGRYVAGDRDLPFAAVATGNPAYRDAEYVGHPVRVATYRTRVADRPVVIAVAETTVKRSNAERRILTSMVLTDLLLLGTILVLVRAGVTYGLRPLLRLREEIALRSARDLAPLAEPPAPGEVLPLVRALNRLFAMVREAAQAQQRFLASAAHQLRTPLAGLQAQLELLARDPANAVLRERLEALHAGCRRLAHTANQLLALARAEPTATLADELRPTDLRSLAERAVVEHLDDALRKGLDLGVEAEPARVPGIAWLLRELLVNLIDNAIAYTESGGRITVRCGTVSDGAFLEVEDDGPGIPEAERGRLGERFYRIPGTAGTGSGLGLAIVREIATLHGATLDIRTGDGGIGTCMRVSFPTSA